MRKRKYIKDELAFQSQTFQIKTLNKIQLDKDRQQNT